MITPKDICFVSSHYPLDTYFAKRTRKSFEKYTKIHGYNFFYDEDPPEREVMHVLHYKRCTSLQKACEKYPDTKWFVWTDSDVYVNKYDVPVETQIDLTDLNILYHLFHENNWGIYPINTGVKFVNIKAIHYEKTIWEIKDTHPWYEFPYEQKAVYEYVLPKIPNQYIIHDPYVLNCITKAYPDKIKDCLFVHLCNYSTEDRNKMTSINILRDEEEYINKIKELEDEICKLKDKLKKYNDDSDDNKEENTYPHLQIGWSQGYMGLEYHWKDALIEKGMDESIGHWCPPIAIFSEKYYNSINDLEYKKIHDYCFIGSIGSSYERREWVIDFAKKHFTSNSIFLNTDYYTDWESLGDFDYTNKQIGYCPRFENDNQSRKVQYRVVQENLFYFEKMRQSKFVLCPAGDSFWSFRFYEVLMCKSLPIVESWHHTYRTLEESNIDYMFVVYNTIVDKPPFDDSTYNELVNMNTKTFKKYHMLH